MSSALDRTMVGGRPLYERRASDDSLVQRLEQLNDIGTSLSAERDINRLLETILSAAKAIMAADGGTLYRVTDDNTSSTLNGRLSPSAALAGSRPARAGGNSPAGLWPFTFGWSSSSSSVLIPSRRPQYRRSRPPLAGLG